MLALRASADRIAAPPNGAWYAFALVRSCFVTSAVATLLHVHMTFTFEATLWEWDARDDSSWVFVTLPHEISEEIRDLGLSRRGFGSVRVQVRCGTSEWNTSVFPDSKQGSYVLPLKKAVRTKQKIGIGDTASFEVDIAPE